MALEHNEAGSLPGVLTGSHGALRCSVILHKAGVAGTTMINGRTLDEMEADMLALYQDAFAQARDHGSFPVATGAKGGGGGNGGAISREHRLSTGRKAAAAAQNTHPVGMDDIIGAAEAKEAIQDRIIYPIKFAGMYDTPARGIMFYGPPGTGKTMMAMAVATSVQEAGKGLLGVIFREVGAASLTSRFYGETGKVIEKTFADLSAAAEESAKAQGLSRSRAILFLDEAEALLSSRQDDGNKMAGVSTGPFLTAVGGKEFRNVSTIIATNLPWSLDSAVSRRFDEHILIDIPGVHELFGNLRRLMGIWCMRPFFVQDSKELFSLPAASSASSSPIEDRDTGVGKVIRDLMEVELDERAAKLDRLMGEEDAAAGDAPAVAAIMQQYSGARRGESQYFRYMENRWAQDVLGGESGNLNRLKDVLITMAVNMRKEGFSQSDVARLLRKVKAQAARVTQTSQLRMVFVPNLTVYARDSTWMADHKDTPLKDLLRQWREGEKRYICRPVWTRVHLDGEVISEMEKCVKELKGGGNQRMWKDLAESMLVGVNALQEVVDHNFHSFVCVEESMTHLSSSFLSLHNNLEGAGVIEMEQDLFARTFGFPSVDVTVVQAVNASDRAEHKDRLFLKLDTLDGTYVARIPMPEASVQSKQYRWKDIAPALEGADWWVPRGVQQDGGTGRLVSEPHIAALRPKSKSLEEAKNADEVVAAFEFSPRETTEAFTVPLYATNLPALVQSNMHSASFSVWDTVTAGVLSSGSAIRWDEYAAMVMYKLSSKRSGAPDARGKDKQLREEIVKKAEEAGKEAVDVEWGTSVRELEAKSKEELGGVHSELLKAGWVN